MSQRIFGNSASVTSPGCNWTCLLILALALLPLHASAQRYKVVDLGAGTERTSPVRISDVEIAIAARACLVKGMKLHVVRENGKPVATKCTADLDKP
jgi:hypothetical protein